MAKAKTQTGNPFLNGDFPGVLDFTKLAEQFRLPGVDSDALLENQRRNFEAVTKANQVAFAGLQAIAQRHAELVRETMDGTAKSLRALATPGQPVETWAVQTEMLKEAYELAFANVRELAELGTKCNGEAAEVLTHRVSDSLAELKGAFQPATAVNPEKAAAK